MTRVSLLLMTVFWLAVAGQVCAQTAADFDREIAPLLARRCLGCHNSSDKKGGLALTAAKAAAAGGDSGPALVPGKPDDSLLWERISQNEMPPKHPLPDAEKALFKTWLAAGAKWGTDPIDIFRYSTETRAGYDWWSLQPVRRPEPPPIIKDAGWPKNALDRFVLASLEAKGLHPAAEADKRTLIRRVTFDLLGLPPSPEEVERFVSDARPQAYEELVERLLASPHYGERWARHWLDVVRYGESQGFERDKLRSNAWQYRDWVVESFNNDLPFDEFIRLQIAGDVLRQDDPRAVIATGFLVAGAWDEVGQQQQSAAMKQVVRQDEMEDYIAVTSQTFLALTVNCARCHDHKFDPISQREYYQLSAALAGVKQGERESLTEVGRTQHAERIQALQSGIAEHERQLANCDDATKRRDLLSVLSQLRMELQLVSGGKVYAVLPSPPDVTHLLERGDTRLQREIVNAGGVKSLTGVSADFQLKTDAPEGQRRVKLAEWIASENNPLTARVLANRLWHYHFGTGLVDTPNDFGFNGGRPTHPELLDWLASELVNGQWSVVGGQSQASRAASAPGANQPSTIVAELKSKIPTVKTNRWSLKHLHRLIVTSATYRQAGEFNSAAHQVDANNRLLWHRSPQRLEAEAVRDAVLSVAGELNPALGGPGFRDFTTFVRNTQFYEMIDPVGYAFQRRSLYRTWIRSGRSELLDVFDCPDPSTTAPKRAVTTTPLQALSLLNNSFMLRMADKMSERLVRECGDDVARQTARAYELAYARPPRADELTPAREFITTHGLAAFCRVLFNSNEFLHID